MKTRPVVAAVFVGCCLLLCGLILRHQIAAHPLPPAVAQREWHGSFGEQARFWRMGMAGWRPAPLALRTLAHGVVAGQMNALASGDGLKAWGYQDRLLRQKIGGPTLFMQMISRQYPEFLHPGRVQFGPVLIDKSGTQAREEVILQGMNGHLIWAGYQLVRENGQFKVGGVQTFQGPN